MVCRHANILESVGNILLIGSDQGMKIFNQATCLDERLLKFLEVWLIAIAECSNCTVCV